MEYIALILISILLTLVILVQNGTGGLGAAWGGTSSYQTKRGLEKGLFNATFILGIIFVFACLLILVK